MEHNIKISIIFLCFASGMKAQNNITDTPSNEGVNVCMSILKNVGYNNFTFYNTDQNIKYYEQKNKIDNSEVETMFWIVYKWQNKKGVFHWNNAQSI